MTYHCRVCSKDRLEVAAEIDGDYCCIMCAEDHDSFGRFEAYKGDLEAIGKALILYEWDADGMSDDFMHQDGWGYVAQMNQYLLLVDDRGFVTYEDYETAEKAQKRYDELHDDGWGAQEDDAYIYSDGYRYSVSFDGKELNVWPRHEIDGITRRRCLARIRLEMMTTGYYPNVWEVSDHGNVRLVKGL